MCALVLLHIAYMPRGHYPLLAAPKVPRFWHTGILLLFTIGTTHV